MRAMVCVVKLWRPVSHLEISESRLWSILAKSFWLSPLFFQNLTQSLCYSKRQVKLSFLFGWNCCKAITEKFILYHNYKISKVALSISVIIFFSMVITPFFCAKIHKEIKDCSLLSEYFG